MRGRFVVLLLLAGGFLVGGLLLTLLQRSRAAQSLVYSVNNVRELSQFALLSGAEDAHRARGTFPVDPKFKPTPLDRLRELNVAAAIPAGTVFRPELTPDRRLSWIAALSPFAFIPAPFAALRRLANVRPSHSASPTQCPPPCAPVRSGLIDLRATGNAQILLELLVSVLRGR